MAVSSGSEGVRLRVVMPAGGSVVLCQTAVECWHGERVCDSHFGLFLWFFFAQKPQVPFEQVESSTGAPIG